MRPWAITDARQFPISRQWRFIFGEFITDWEGKKGKKNQSCFKKKKNERFVVANTDKNLQQLLEQLCLYTGGRCWVADRTKDTNPSFGLSIASFPPSVIFLMESGSITYLFLARSVQQLETLATNSCQSWRHLEETRRRRTWGHKRGS